MMKKEHKFIDGIEYKTCTNCLMDKLLTEYTKTKDNWDRLRPQCKKCYVKKTKQRNEKNRELLLEKRRNPKSHRLDNVKKPHIIINGIESKHCYRCKQYVSIDNFYKLRRNWDGLCDDCKDCNKKSSQQYNKNNKLKIGAKRRKYQNNRIKTDPIYKMIRNMRNRVWCAIEKNCKSATTLELLGCTPKFLKEFLEKKFTDGMSWGNYGSWHIDHIKPIAAFDMSKSEEQKLAFHYTNLQPLWVADNLKKGDKY